MRVLYLAVVVALTSAGCGGDGTTTDSNVPVAVAGRLTFQSLSAGARQTCGVTTAGAAYCWGDNRFGTLGDGSRMFSNVPVAVAGMLTFQSLSADDIFHSCGVTTAGVGYCWGLNNFGQLGDGTKISSNMPVAVLGGLTFQTVSAGGAHSCGLTTAGASST